jgi:transcriptional regulator with XRE-family HTH domain
LNTGPNILGDFIHEAAVDAREAEAKGGSAFGAWLSKTRTEKGMSVPELASKSGITAPAIYNIESGKSLNPQKETRRRLEQALGASIPADVTKEAERAQEIKGLGSLTDFDPYDEQNLPAVAGVYVFYDIAERPIYVGKAAIIASRVKEHKEKFWFRPPIVINAAYVPVSDATVRHQIEQVLIKFLKSNAVINRQSVERDSGS